MEVINSAAPECVNCGISLKRKFKAFALQLSVENIAAISANIAPYILTESDYVCKTCSQFAIDIIDNSKTKCEKEDKSMYTTEIDELQQQCLLCEISLIGRQSQAILKDNPSDIDKLLCKVVEKASSLNREITVDDKLCAKCWSVSKRSAFVLEKQTKGHQSVSGAEDSSSGNSNSEDGYDEPLIKIELLPIKSEQYDENPIKDFEIADNSTLNNETVVEGLSNTETDDDDEQSDKSEPFYDNPRDLDFIPRNNRNIRNNRNLRKENGWDSEPKAESQIRLLNYKRSPNQSSKCIFINCKNPERLRIPKEIKVRVLRDHHYFITENARICSNHLQSNDWGLLFNQKNSMPSFRESDIEQVIDLVQTRKKKLDFDNVLNLDENLFKFLLGITKEKFTNIIKKIPALCKVQLGLVALLIYHNSESNNNNKLSCLLNVPRRTIVYTMNTVKRILTNHPQTKEFGIEYILKEKELLHKKKSLM